MNSAGRAKKWAGGASYVIPTQTVLTGGSIYLDDDDTTLYIQTNGGGAISTSTSACFNFSRIIPERVITLINIGADAITIKHTAIASAASGTYTGSADLALGTGDVLTVKQLNNGGFIRISSADNA